MPTLVIASITERAGRTAVAATLAARLGAESHEVALGRLVAAESEAEEGLLARLVPEAIALKPVESGSPEDIQKFVRARTNAPVKAASGKIAIVDGEAGDAGPNLALAEAVDGLVILVAHYGEDVQKAAAGYGSRLAGVIINAVPRYRQTEVQSEIIPALSGAGVRVLGTIPEDRRLLAPTIAQVSEALDGQFVAGEDRSEGLIDSFLIGGLVLDWGPFYFQSQQNVGVVVRGDRPDVQLAALQSDTTRALFLTKGVPPVEYVLYEADQQGIPMAVVPTNTEETAQRLEDLLPDITFDHPEKLVRMLELMESAVDFDAIEDALSQPVTG